MKKYLRRKKRVCILVFSFCTGMLLFTACSTEKDAPAGSDSEMTSERSDDLERAPEHEEESSANQEENETYVTRIHTVDGWWYLDEGEVKYEPAIPADDQSRWFHEKRRKGNLLYTGIAGNEDGWWYIKDGKAFFKAGDYSFAEHTSQIIDVKATGSSGTLTLYNKQGNSFTEIFSVDCHVGKNGISSQKKEGDKKTPSGVYTLSRAFGVADDPGCTREYLKLNSHYYWVDDSTSDYYNQLVDASQTGIVWKSAEHLSNSKTEYKYAIAIDYNMECIPYKGSAIFLHCSTGRATSGCVSIAESDMVTLLTSLREDTLIYIHEAEPEES